MRPNHLRDIIDYLFLSPLQISRPGLLDGNMGIALALYYIGENTGDSKYTKKANDLLDNVYECLNQDLLTFEGGLTGIGWGIEQIAGKRFVSGNTDYVLVAVDEALYRHIQTVDKYSLNLTNGLSVFLLYIVKRLLGKRRKKQARDLILEELLCLVIDKIENESKRTLSFINKDIYANLIDPFSFTILALSEAFKLGIYNEKIEMVFQLWIYQLKSTLPEMHTHRLLLATALQTFLLTKNEYKDCTKSYYSSCSLYWIKQVNELESVIATLLISIDTQKVFAEMNPYSIKIQDGWCGYACLLWNASQLFSNTPYSASYELLRKHILRIHMPAFMNYIRKVQSSKLFICPLCIKDGLAGIAMLEMLYPQAYYE